MLIPQGLIHHSDRYSQYLSINYTELLTKARFQASLGSVGDSYDNAMAETINGLFKTEVIRRNGPWNNVDAVEYATLEGVNWFNNQPYSLQLAMSHPLNIKRATMIT